MIADIGTLKRSLMAASALATAVLVSGGTLLTVNAARTSVGPALTAVSAGTLAGEGITLSNPTASATVGQSTAVQTAQAQLPGSQVDQVVLAQVQDSHQNPRVDRLCWVVSLSPSGAPHSSGPPGSAALAAGYFVVFVDAQTGAFLFGTSGSGD